MDEIWCLELWEEHRVRAFENRMLRRIYEPRREEVTGRQEKIITRSFIICDVHNRSSW
jgi:hypothetical protein